MKVRERHRFSYLCKGGMIGGVNCRSGMIYGKYVILQNSYEEGSLSFAEVVVYGVG